LDCKPAKYGGEGEKERGEAGCKVTANLDIETKKLYERDKWVIY